jgi:hypothetical protein
MRTLLYIMLVGLLFVLSCRKDKAERMLTPDEIEFKKYCDSIGVTYTNDVYPIIHTNCVVPGCHGAGATWDYTTYAGLKAKVDNGSFEQRVIIQRSMPDGPPLSAQEIDILKCWLLDGAPNN